LYGLVFAGTTLFLVRLAGWFDRYVLDGIVNLVAATTARVSRVIGWGDDRVIDGAVTGASQVVWELGIAARAPQTGRIRVYVTALMLVVVIGVAVTVGVMMWR
jgi:NADH-quinone oxidoreductase subunit L